MQKWNTARVLWEELLESVIIKQKNPKTKNTKDDPAAEVKETEEVIQVKEVDPEAGCLTNFWEKPYKQN